MQSLLEAASSDAPSVWTPLFAKKGVRAFTRAQDAAAASASSGSESNCVKGVSVMPYRVAEIYSLVADPARRVELDSNLTAYQRLRWFSRHTGVEHLQFKAVWPTTARDFCNLTHWRLLSK